jgi:hypothetical protein
MSAEGVCCNSLHCTGVKRATFLKCNIQNVVSWHAGLARPSALLRRREARPHVS